ncbi:MAG TPA: PKD domain-containing protein [Candidatus Hydrogenedentes bacterium]|nr:PKD domain-containing protein [Candidatus Hydrogenedentota bacterium]
MKRHTIGLWVLVAGFTLWLSAASYGAVTVLNTFTAKDEGDSQEFTVSVNVPAGTELAVAGVTNRDDRGVEYVQFVGQGNFHLIVDSEPSTMDERAALLYYKQPPSGTVSLKVRLMGNSRHKAVGVLFLSNVNLAQFSPPGTPSPLLPLAKYDGAFQSNRPSVSMVFTGSEAPAGSLVISSTTCKGDTLNIANTPAHVQRWSQDTVYKVLGITISRQQHRGSSIAGSPSGATVSWNYGDNWGLAAVVIPPRPGLQGITTTGLTVGDNAPAGTSVGTLVANDPDNLGPYTWTLLDNAGGRFTLDASNTASVTVRSGDPSLFDAGTASTHTIRARVSDTYGNSVEQDFTVTVTDTTPPEIGSLTALPVIARSGVLVTLRAAVTDNVGLGGLPSLTVSGNPVADPALSGGEYAWMYVVPGSLPDGYAPVHISAADTSSNPASRSFPSVLLIDNTLPSLGGLAASTPYARPGDTVTVSVSASDANGLAGPPTLTIGGFNAGAPSSQSGDTFSWNFVIPGGMPEGYPAFNLSVTDTAGNTRTGYADTLLLVDATAPVISGFSCAPAWAMAGTVVTFTATVTDNYGLASLPTLQLNGTPVGAPSVSGTTYTWTTVISATEQQGPATITITAQDNAGNSASYTPSGTVLTIDRTPPTITGLSCSPTLAKPGMTVTISATVMDNYALNGLPTLTVNGLAAPAPIQSGYAYTWTYVVPSGVAEGWATVTLSAVDMVGNVRTVSSTTLLNLDPNGPVVSNVSATPAEAKYNTPVTIQATITDYTGVSGTPTLTVNGIAATFSGASGNVYTWTYTVGAMVPEGPATLRFTANDVLNNTTVYNNTSALLIDRTPPVIANVQVIPSVAKGGDVVRIRFDATDAYTSIQGQPTVSVNGVSAQYYSVSGSTYEYRYTVRANEPEGAATIVLTARDRVANAGFRSENSLLMIDRSAPTVSLVTVDPPCAGNGQQVMIGFRITDPGGLGGYPTVTVNGHAATRVGGAGGAFEYSYTVIEGQDPDGPASIAITVSDLVGNSGTSSANGLLTVDTMPPAGSVTIENGATYTRSIFVTLGVTASDGAGGCGVTSMSFSADGAQWTGWEAITSTRSWELTASTGWKRVYARFRDAAGNVSAPVYDEIAYKPNPLAVDREGSAEVTVGRGNAVVLEASPRNVFGRVLSYEWRKNGETVYDNQGNKVDGPVLALENVSFEDEGEYVCVVVDELETATSAPFTVRVMESIPVAGPLGLTLLVGLLAGAGMMASRKRSGSRLLALLVTGAVVLGGLAGTTGTAWAEAAVVYSAHCETGGLDNASLEALAREKGSVEVWERDAEGKVIRKIARWGDPAHANPLFVTTQAEAMDEWLARGAKSTVMKDGTEVVSADLGEGLILEMSRPQVPGGPTFESRLIRGGEVLLTEQWWEERSPEGILRPRFIRIDDGQRAMVQVFEYTDTPPEAFPPVSMKVEGPERPIEGKVIVYPPVRESLPDKSGLQSQEVQFLVPQQGLDNLGFDSGWIPSGGYGDPGGFVIQVRVRANAGFNYDASVNGLITLDDTGLLGVGPANGTWGFYFGAEFYLKGAVDLSWVPLIGQFLQPFTVDVPYVPDFNLVASDRDDFSSWLLDEVSELRDEAGRTNITSVDLISLALSQGILPQLPSWLPVKPSVVVGLDIAAIANGTLTCDSIDVNDQIYFTTEGQQLPVTVPPEGYTGIASYNENASLNLGAKLYPYITASVKVFSWSWGYTYPDSSDPNNLLNQIEWLPIKLRNFPFNDVELNFTGLPSQGNPTDWFTQQFTTYNNNLSGKRVRFTPNLSNNFYVACLEENVTDYRTAIEGSTEIPLPDDGFAAVDLQYGQKVSLYGQQYSRIYIGSNGYITFDSGDTTSSVSLENHFSQPRVSGLFYNLKPDQGGKVYFKQLPNRAVITYDDVRVGLIQGQKVDVQVELFYDGRIVITWKYLDPTVFGLVGLSRGGGKPSDFVMSRFVNYPTCLSGIAPEAGVRVNFQPPEVLLSTPRWRVGSSPWMPSGTALSLPIGTWGVTFNTLPNLWQSPQPVIVTLNTPDVYVDLSPVWVRERGTVNIYTQPSTASWRLTGPDGVDQTGTGNATLAGMPTGNYTLEWLPLATYDQPVPTTLTRFLYPNMSVIFNGTYSPRIGEGIARVSVVLVPQAALDAGGQWRINGGAWLNSGDVVEVPDGNSTLTYKDIPGWTAPVSQTLFFERDKTTTLTREYIRHKGTVIVDVDPNTAQWELTDGDGNLITGTGDQVLTGVPTGTISTRWLPLASYTEPTPNPSVFTLNNNATYRVTGAYVPVIGEGEGIVRVFLHPDGAVNAGAQWRLLGGEWRSSGGMQAAPDGEQVIRFRDIDGWQTPADMTVNVSRDIINDFHATYARLYGSLQVQVTPDTAAWLVVDADGNEHAGTGDALLTGIPAGTARIQWGDLEGYDPPDPNPAEVVVPANGTATVTGEYLEAIVTADFEAWPLSGPAPLEVTFTDRSTSTTKSIIQWRWYFGDGKMSDEQNPTHVYREPGTYTVTLLVNTIEKSDSATKRQWITVTDAIPVAGPAGLALVALALALAGAWGVRRCCRA